MSELTTYCSDCLNNHTNKCMDARKNSWHCPDYVKKMSEHEKHIMRIAEEISKIPTLCGKCPSKCNWGTEETCKAHLYKWMMSLKEGD